MDDEVIGYDCVCDDVAHNRLPYGNLCMRSGLSEKIALTALLDASSRDTR